MIWEKYLGKWQRKKQHDNIDINQESIGVDDKISYDMKRKRSIGDDDIPAKLLVEEKSAPRMLNANKTKKTKVTGRSKRGQELKISMTGDKTIKWRARKIRDVTYKETEFGAQEATVETLLLEYHFVRIGDVNAAKS